MQDTASFARGLNGGGSASNRVSNDHYTTPRECTVALMNFLKLTGMPYIWEPACGKGDISKVLIDYEAFVYSTDLMDYGYGETGIDYLTAEAPEDVDAIITNPPFNLAVEFVNKALADAPLVAMLFKSQFWHAKARIPLFNRTTPKYVLPMTWRPQFMEGKTTSPVMEVCWTVWEREHTGSCTYLPLDKPIL